MTPGRAGAGRSEPGGAGGPAGSGEPREPGEWRGPGEPHESYAGIVTRLLALGVDASFLAVGALVVGLGAPALWSAVDGNSPDWLDKGSQALAGLLPLIYFWTCWGIRGQTLGGLLAGMAVCRRDGSRLGFFRAGPRAFLGLAFAPVWLVGMVLVPLDRRRRALHDVLLRTVVRRV